jgi:peroxiredoxin
LIILILCITAGSAFALAPGDPAPAFDLPWLQGDGSAASSAIYAQSDATVLVIWNRGCPRCTQIALGMNELADSLAPRGGQIVGILFGPDDPQSLKDLLWDREIPVPHLWDATAGTASDYDLGIRHLGVFVIDRSGTIRSLFDDQIPNLIGPVMPAAIDALGHPAAIASAGRSSSAIPAWPDLSIDGRIRFLSTEGARAGDIGLNGETLENGAALLTRFDLRMTWPLARAIEFVPWLRVSNETDAVLTEGAEQLASPHGTASLNVRIGRLSGILGAYPLRLSPLLLQRWDADDAPPLGGASGCGCGGGGGGGLQQYSLEILGPSYTFEGASAAWSHRLGRLRGFVAVPHWERRILTTAGPSETQKARFRRTLGGASIDLGAPGALDPRFELPTPLGLRAGYLTIGDDQRSIAERGYVRPAPMDERGWFLLGRAGPWKGLTADAEYVDWRLDRASRKQPSRDATGYRAGLRCEEPLGPAVLWGQAHRLRTENHFAPTYGALTYEENREGWRFWAGVRRLERAGGTRERCGLTLFYRAVREVEAITWAEGRIRERLASVSLSARPMRDLVAGAHGIFSKVDRPGAVPDLTTRGVSADLRWDGIAALEPVLRLDALRRDDGESDPRTIWEGSLSVRISK